ncbi:MAG: T9SS type A sorting domain-containing protein [Calditrichia bacterium]
MLKTLLIFSLAISLFFSNLSAQEVPENLVYRDVSATNLPLASLGNNNMDARPADLDGDGDLDIVIAVEFVRNIILINNGSGVFTNESNTRLPAQNNDSEDIGIADFDNNGTLDILFVSEDDSTNELYLNDGNGFFTNASSRIPVNGVSNAVLVTDLTGDSIPDIIIGNDGTNRVLINDGSGNFTDETLARYPRAGAITQDLEWGDIDGDGDGDIIEGNEDGNRVLINDGSGTFADETSARITFTFSGEETREADLGDVDNDGDLDLFFANVTFLQGRPSQNRLLLNDGDGFFLDVTGASLPSETFNTIDADFNDIDGDGDEDIIAVSAFVGTYQIFINDGSGIYSDSTSRYFLPPPNGSGVDAEFADFTGDNIPDIYLTGFQRQDYLFVGEVLTGIETPAEWVNTFELLGNYPNPFNPSTAITFRMARAGAVELNLYDLGGRLVRNLTTGFFTAGEHTIKVSASNLTSGVYIYTLQSGNKRTSRKMVLLK